ncbi:fibrillin-2-like isoform X2 [Rhopilema esculentum]|uniref:fibrillin-2-like isoform X2 n=1 Tax=Rhopilema esculentum TaxID=499914 RepID=UPI0031D27E64
MSKYFSRASIGRFTMLKHIQSYASAVTWRICEIFSQRVFAAKNNFFHLIFNRPWTRTGYRGIMVGYVAYREDEIDECTRGLHRCSSNAFCTNTVGSYRCICKSSYTGNGYSCIGVNECLQGTHRCSTNATCINTDLWYRCTCNSGYTGNGYSCVPAGHDSSSTSKSKTGAAVYIGGAIGCAVFLGIVFICCCKRSHHCSRTSTATETGHSQSATSGTLNAANASANDTRMQKTEQWQQPHSAVVFSEANAPSIILAPFPHYAANTTAITNTVTSPEYPTAIMPNDLISEPPPSYSAVMASNIYSPPQNPNFVYPALN